MLANYTHAESNGQLGHLFLRRHDSGSGGKSLDDVSPKKNGRGHHNDNWSQDEETEGTAGLSDDAEQNGQSEFSGDNAENDLAVEDSVALYLKEISRIPLINAKEEVELAKAIEKGQRGLSAVIQ